MLGIYWSRDSCDSNNIAVRLQLSTAFESNVLDQRNDQREKGGIRKKRRRKYSKKGMTTEKNTPHSSTHTLSIV